jgi:hypothetical protein
VRPFTSYPGCVALFNTLTRGGRPDGRESLRPGGRRGRPEAGGSGERDDAGERRRDAPLLAQRHLFGDHHDQVYDRLYVEVRSTTGALLATLGTLSNLQKAATGVCTLRAFSLAQWNGQTVRVQFRATTDGWLATSFRVDDVSLQ